MLSLAELNITGHVLVATVPPSVRHSDRVLGPPAQDLHTVDFQPYQVQQGRVNITGFRLLRDGWRQSADSCAQGQDWRSTTNQMTVRRGPGAGTFM